MSTTPSSFADDVRAGDYDGLPVAELARRLAVPGVHAYMTVRSTMDVAHALAADGVAAGTVIVADVQTAGRGRNGRRWVSDAGAGVWATILERPRDVDALGVLSLRVGMALAAQLQSFVEPSITLKWPNDLLVGGRKLAGVLVEARWREALPEWVAIGIGVNRRPPPDVADTVGVGETTRPADVLIAVVRAVRAATGGSGLLSAAELAEFAARDAVYGRPVIRPVVGRAAGITSGGELLIETEDGVRHPVPTATVAYAPDRP